MVNPSEFPSTPPSVIPTNGTSSPSELPTEVPLIEPNLTPSVDPTLSPSAEPTVPSGTPSSLPSSVPTVLPTIITSIEPSPIPSTLPSSQPFSLPTSIPSGSPLAIPTIIPTGYPSSLPSNMQTPSPSGSPSTYPSNQPTSEPSLQGIVTDYPSSLPSLIRSDMNTGIPSSKPSSIHSVKPSTIPTSVPSVFPSLLPSGLSSDIPVLMPADQPTIEPSALPSSTPSDRPSSFPSHIPSVTPTNRPTRFPSSLPISNPSSQPSSKSSGYPTSHPISQPTMIASVQPSQKPNTQPTSQPSRRPTAQPTSQPSSQPISHPSASPSATPTLFVSPTPVPSQYPTPSTSSMIVPTVTPSFIPSCAPTSSLSAFPDSRIFKGWLFMFGGMVGSQQSVHSNIYLTGSYVGSSYVVLGRSKREEDVTLQGQSSWEGVMEVLDGGVQQDSVSRSTTNVGDINRDGKDDWVLGDPSSSRGYVLFGESSSLTNLRVSVMLVENADSLSPTRSGLGWACAGLGDMNVDGFGDFIITAPTGNVVYVVYGRARRNFPSQLVLSLMSSRQGYKIVGSGRDRSFGMSVSSGGDFNGDGRRDILISALRSSSSSQATIYVIAGNGSSVVGGAGGGVSGKPLVVSVDGLGNSSYFKMMSVKGSFTGLSVSWVGDMNGDGYDDVGIGSAPYQSGGLVEQQTYVVYGRDWVGSTSGVNEDGGESGMGNVLWLLGMRSGVDGFVVRGGGFMVSGVGDVDGDGLSDMMVSSYGGWLGKGNAYITVYPNNITHFPSVAPSSRPSSSPLELVHPTSSPSSYPPYPNFPHDFPRNPSPTRSLIATRFPTKQPSILPSRTRSPLFLPSIRPTSSSPLAPPSRRPSLTPTVSIRPTSTKAPIPAPTSYPSTASPTLVDTELSSQSPSLLIKVNNTGTFNPPTAAGGVTINLVISVNGSVHIMGSQRRTIYTILRSEDGSTNSEISIEVFRDDYDQLDLSAFPEYGGLGELPHESPPLRLLLSSRQSVVLENHRSYDLSASSVVFAPSLSSDPSGTMGRRTLLILSIGIGLTIVLCSIGIISDVYFKRKVASKEHKKIANRQGRKSRSNLQDLPISMIPTVQEKNSLDCIPISSHSHPMNDRVQKLMPAVDEMIDLESAASTRMIAIAEEKNDRVDRLVVSVFSASDESVSLEKFSDNDDFDIPSDSNSDGDSDSGSNTQSRSSSSSSNESHKNADDEHVPESTSFDENQDDSDEDEDDEEDEVNELWDFSSSSNISI